VCPRLNRILFGMRCAIVRGWISLTTALVTAAVADAGTEFAENLGWLGGSVRDAQHQAVAPMLVIGLAVGAALAVFVAFARIAPRDPLLRCMSGLRARTTDLAIALSASALGTIAMEGYETQFGGLSPFDPRSVVCSHALALVVAFVLVTAIARAILSATLRFASRAGEFATSAVVEFLHKIFRAPVARGAVHSSAFTLHVLHLPPAIAEGACGLRAPPHRVLPTTS
jgi:hypothetical protein